MAENTYDSLIFIDLFILFIHVTEVMNSSRGKTLNNMEFETKSSLSSSYHMNSSCNFSHHHFSSHTTIWSRKSPVFWSWTVPKNW
jgi:hypothetical protein